ncbi:MAG: hypothetical protein H6908_02075 [Hyphomicrobiales bacterium]|nr:hypothetical protein [Hyphomicrobiales bacterium]
MELDGSSYENCDFYHCIIKYKASESFTLVNCNFEGVKWVLEGPAELTMRFLAATYTGMGEGGKQLIDDTFQNIKNGKY